MHYMQKIITCSNELNKKKVPHFYYENGMIDVTFNFMLSVFSGIKHIFSYLIPENIKIKLPLLKKFRSNKNEIIIGSFRGEKRYFFKI